MKIIWMKWENLRLKNKAMRRLPLAGRERAKKSKLITIR